jgi:DNA repair protein RecN (Recombination protein N)
LTVGLKRIVLRDFVIVRELDLDLALGFSAFTGETGAGKSILIDALQLVTGARSDAALVREGCQRAEVSAEFDSTDKLQAWLKDAGFEHDEPLLLLRRTVDMQGKSRAWINASPATATQLRSLGEQLLDIHGQHAWQSLTRADEVRTLLDAYAQVNSQAVAQCWQQWRSAQHALEQALAAQNSLQFEREKLTWQIGELKKLDPGVNEWPELNTEHTRLSHAQALLEAAQKALEWLDDGPASALGALHQAKQALHQQAHVEPAFEAIGDVLGTSLHQVQDSIHTLRGYLRKTELDPARLEELDQRMGLWLSLARRYKCAPEELGAVLLRWQAELAQLEASADLDALRQAQDQARAAYMRQAQALSEARAQAAPRLAQAITEAMQGLGMQGGRFEVALQTAAQALQSGLEEVSFLVAGHAGSSPRPISKVASGGELSRIALAIAVTTSQFGSVQTLIFDEIDSGVGGAVAHTVGRLMKRLGANRQVLAVTHLPQVAASADHHWLVAKQQSGNATLSSVTALQGEHRLSEIARMLGGEHLSDTTRAHAREMLQSQA